MHLLSVLQDLPTSLLITSFALLSAALPVHTTELTPDNFKQTTAHGLWFVEHFSPYCIHCKRFAPTWKKLEEDSQTEIPSVKLAQVDCAVHGDLCDQNGVTGYPTILMFEDGKMVKEYKGSRDIDDLKTFMKGFAKEEPPAPPAAIAIVEEKEPAAPQTVLNPLGELLPLTDKTFTSVLAEGPTFVKFFAPWCGHCKKLAPVWKQLARHLKGTVTVAEVNCDDNTPLCKSEHIEGYPTLIYFGNGVRSEYKGARKLEQLKAFAEKASAPGLQSISTPAQFDKHVKEDNIAYLLLQPVPDTKITNFVKEASAVLLGAPRIYTSTSHELLERYSLSGAEPWTILSFKDYDSETPSSILPGTSSLTPSTASKLKDWLLSHRLPTSLELTQDTFQSVMNAPHAPLVVIAAVTKDNKKKVAERFSDVAAKWRVRTRGSGIVDGREVIFTWMDSERWAEWMKNMYGIKKGSEGGGSLDDVPVIIADHSKLIYYDKDQSGVPIKFQSSPDLFAAVQDAVAGKLAYKHSENMVERMATYLNAKLTSLESYVMNNPFYSAFFVLCIISLLIFGIRRLVVDDVSQVYGQKEVRNGKGGRLD